jgi:hypothetical protein
MELFEYEKRILNNSQVVDDQQRAEKTILNAAVELADRAYGIDDTVEVRYPNNDELSQFKQVWNNQRTGPKDQMSLTKATKKFKRIFEDRLEDRANNWMYSIRGNLYEEMYKYTNCHNN